MYVSELDRLNRIKELLNEETCKELINLSKLNVDEYKSIDNLKVLIDVLNKIKITQTNDIYVCTGTFITDCDICYQDTTWYTRAVPFDADYAEYRCYSDIENNHTIRAYTKPEFWRSYNPHGYQSLRDALCNSCNPAFMQLGERITAPVLSD